MDRTHQVKYPWQRFVLDAFLEFEPADLQAKITAAERAISKRLLEGSLDPEEHTALRDALRALAVLIPQAARPEERVDEAQETA